MDETYSILINLIRDQSVTGVWFGSDESGVITCKIHTNINNIKGCYEFKWHEGRKTELETELHGYHAEIAWEKEATEEER